MRLMTYLGFAAIGSLLGAGALSACSGATDGNEVGGGAQPGTGGTGGGGGLPDSGIAFDSGNPDGGSTDASACGKLQETAQIEIKPADIVFIVDNSCSMNQEAQGVQDNIATNFAQIISASGIDYRVILISDNGPTSSGSICVGPPLGNSICPPTSGTAPKNNPPLFYHFDKGDVYSTDGWCKAKQWYNQADVHGLAPGGWKDWLRPGSLKAFVMVTDDRVSCSGYTDSSNPLATAQKFDQDLMALDPTMFGTVANRNYVWYSIVGVGANPADPTGAYQPNEPITSSKCSGAVNASPGNQALSQITGGLRFPVCNGFQYDEVFKAIAKGVIAGAKVACDFQLPDPPKGKEFNLDSVSVNYTPGGSTTPQHLTQVANAALCAPGKFYIDTTIDRVFLCPAACGAVQQDPDAKLDVLVDCVTDVK